MKGRVPDFSHFLPPIVPEKINEKLLADHYWVDNLTNSNLLLGPDHHHLECVSRLCPSRCLGFPIGYSSEFRSMSAFSK